MNRLLERVTAAIAVVLLSPAIGHADAASELTAGIVADRSGQYEQAVERFARVLALPASVPIQRAAAYVLRGRSYQKWGRVEPAVRDFRAGIHLLQELLGREGADVETVAGYRCWLGQAREYSWDLVGTNEEKAAAANDGLGHFGAVLALQGYEQYVDRAGLGMRRLSVGYASWLIETGSFATAQEVLVKALQYRGDGDSEVHSLLGRCHEAQAEGEQRLERLHRAAAEYRTARGSGAAPEDTVTSSLRRVLTSIGRELLDQGDWVGMESAFKEALDLGADAGLCSTWATAKTRWAQSVGDELRRLALHVDAGDLWLHARTLSPAGDLKLSLSAARSAVESYSAAADLAFGRGDTETIGDLAGRMLSASADESRGLYWRAVYLDRTAEPLDDADPQRETYREQARQLYETARAAGLPAELDDRADVRLSILSATAASLRETLVVAADGSAQYSRLQEALRDARPGHRIVLRGRGPYKGSFSISVDDLEIVGETALGADSPQLETSFGSCITVAGGSLAIKRVRINCKSSADPAVNAVRGRFEATRCEISSPKMGVAVSVSGPDDCVLDQCHIRDAEVGVMLFENASASLKGCEVRGNAVGVSLSAHASVVLEGCRIHHNNRSGLFISESSRAQVIDCDIYDSPRSFEGSGQPMISGGRVD